MYCLNLLILFTIFVGSVSALDVIDGLTVLRDNLVSQGIVVMFGTLAFSTDMVDRRQFFAKGPASAINAVFTNYKSVVQEYGHENSVSDILKLSWSSLVWLSAPLLLWSTSHTAGIVVLLGVTLSQTLLIFLWITAECKVSFIDDNEYPIYSFMLPKENHISADRDSPPYEEADTGFQLVSDLSKWRQWWSGNGAYGINLKYSPSLWLMNIERCLRIICITSWLIALVLCSLNNKVKNWSLICILGAAISYRSSLTKGPLWKTNVTPHMHAIWNCVSNSINGLINEDSNTQLHKNIFATLYPNVVDPPSENKDSDWLRRHYITHHPEWLKRALKRIEINDGYTAFDLVGIKICQCLWELEDHIFSGCSKTLRSVNTLSISRITGRGRSMICLIASGHIQCNKVKEINKKLEEWLDENRIIYLTLAQVCKEYLPAGMLKNVGNQDIKEWWVSNASRVLCPGYDIPVGMLTLMYMYEMFLNEGMDEYFAYASSIENLTLVPGAAVNFTPTSVRIEIFGLTVETRSGWHNLPNDLWYSASSTNSGALEGMLRTIAHIKLTSTNKRAIEYLNEHQHKSLIEELDIGNTFVNPYKDTPLITGNEIVVCAESD